MFLLFLLQAESEETKQNGEASKSGPQIDDEQEYPEGPLLMTTRMWWRHVTTEELIWRGTELLIGFVGENISGGWQYEAEMKCMHIYYVIYWIFF